jgi:hypothetical protein
MQPATADFIIRQANADEYAPLGRLLAAAYAALPIFARAISMCSVFSSRCKPRSRCG